MRNYWARSYLQGVLAGKTFIAPRAREWLHSQMDALMTLQVVVAVETLWALVTLEGTIVVRSLVSLVRVVVVHRLHIGCVTTVEAYQSLRQASHQHRRTTWIIEIREHRTMGVGLICAGKWWSLRVVTCLNRWRGKWSRPSRRRRHLRSSP